ncbi:long-chain fatty acid--CoA ligase [Streptomyces sp. NBC_00631]|uniref:AMP-dependent synthetase/ligase n=1 Tax=Streptomyces sp. NBC_00631 TaxID=2975793 RepID=UPI0030E226FA
MSAPEVAHVLHLMERQVERVPTHAALSWESPQGLQTLTWSDYRQRVWDAASGLLDLGVAPGDTVAILAPNVADHYVADLAALLCGAATVSLYPTLVEEQLAYILGDARPTVVITVDASAADRIEQALPADVDAHIVCLEGAEAARVSWAAVLHYGAERRTVNEAELSARLAASGGSDTAVYVYTSGTTGMPKGVVLTHANLLAQIGAFDRMGFFLGGYRTISYLPLAHIAERLWSLYFPLANGGNVLLCPDQSQLAACMKRQHPTFFMGVPRIWEKLRDTVHQLLAGPDYAPRAAEVAADREILMDAWTRRQDGLMPADERVRAMRAREGVLSEIRRDLGLDWTINPGSGAAALSDDLRDFWASFGIELINGYGLSETTGVAVWERVGGSTRGSSGFAIPGYEVLIAEDGEILLRGPGNTPGYRNVDRAESQLFVGDWLATGDIGYLDAAGRLFVTDRKKEIIVNASGKNISPTAIEEKMAGNGLVNQAVAIGDNRPYIVGLLTINEPALQAFARARGIEGPVSTLIEHPDVIDAVQRVVDAGNARLSRPEQIKSFRVLAEQWSVDSGELTPTLKLRRRAIVARHADLIDSLYAQPAGKALAAPPGGTA